MTLAQGAVGCVFHDNERGTSFDAEVKALHDVVVLESERACFGEKTV